VLFGHSASSNHLLGSSGLWVLLEFGWGLRRLIPTQTIPFRQILPQVIPIVLTYLTLALPDVILEESFLSVLGLGVRLNYQSGEPYLQLEQHSSIPSNPMVVRAIPRPHSYEHASPSQFSHRPTPLTLKIAWLTAQSDRIYRDL
jgi:hypothetical protein